MIKQDFKKITSIAPGRTCLFGDHQDYLGLPVIACAIDRNITITAKPNTEKKFNIRMTDINDERVIAINELFSELQPRDYFASSLKVLRRYNCIPNVGYDILITGNIPINSGTSSSSALLMAWVNFLVEAFGVSEEVTPEFIAKIGYEAEVLEHGEPGGMMDHYSIGVGKIVYLNTSEPFSCSVIGTSLDGLVTGISGVPKETIGLLRNLKNKALKTAEIIKTTYPHFQLAKTTLDEIHIYKKLLPEKLSPYFIAAVQNHHYTLEALKEFKKPKLDLRRLGQLMNGHHAVLRDLLKITVPKIDTMIDTAISSGAYGAKIVGSGGGGSIVIIAEPGKEQGIVDALLASGAKDAYAVAIDPGVRIAK